MHQGKKKKGPAFYTAPEDTQPFGFLVRQNVFMCAQQNPKVLGDRCHVALMASSLVSSG